MKYLSRRYFKFFLAYVGIIFALSIVHWNGVSIFLNSSLAEAAGPSIGLDINNQGIRRAIEVQKGHEVQLFRIPGVVGVGTGIGANGQAIIKVFTVRAGILDIPQRLEEIPVETKVTGMFVAYSDSPYWFPRPVPIGVSTGHPDITAGTIGCRVTDGTNVYALSNNHVYANMNNASDGDNALQPGTYDGGVNPDDAIGTLFDFQPIDFSIFGSNTIDAAIVLTTPYEVGNATPTDSEAYLEDYVTPNSIIFGDSNSDGFFDNKNDLLLLLVKKLGRTTGLTHGQITAINVTSAVCYANCSNPFSSQYAWFDDQISISSVNSNAFSLGGDSGSLIVTEDNNNPVGLLFAGSDTTTLANRIDLVLDRFGVSVDGGSSSGNITPTAHFTYTIDRLAVDFTDQSTDLDGTITQWSWNFGDGNTSTVQNPAHTYGASGTYTVSLIVVDNDGGSGSTSKEVTVSDGSVATIMLTATGKLNKKWVIVNLDWNGANTDNVEIRRNGTLVIMTSNDGAYTDKINNDGGGPYTYQVCEEGTSTCSAVTPVTF